MLTRLHFGTLALLLYIVAVVAAELLTVYLEPWVGIVCYWLLVVYCIAQVAFNTDTQNRDFLLSLILVPLTRIMSISLPLTLLPQILWYPLIYLPLLASTLVVIWVLGLKLKHVGITKGNLLTQLSFGAASGLAIGILEYLILKPAPLISSLTLEQIWLPAMILFFTTGVVEELIFRGVLQTLAIPALGSPGIIYVSAIFGILHLGFFSLLDVIFVFLIALIFGAFVKKTGSLLGVTLAHGIANIMLFTVAPFVLS